jgi:ankyrin repeat protein
MKRTHYTTALLGAIIFMYTAMIQAGPLHDAVKAGDLEKVKAAVTTGWNVNETFDGLTPLCYAAMEGNYEIVKYLVEHGSDAKFKDSDKQTVLMCTGEINFDKIVPFLVQHGADINARSKTGSTELHYESFGVLPNTVKVLIQNGADVKIKDNYGETALHRATLNSHYVIHGYDKNKSYARSDNEETIKLLLDAGADINARDNEGKTPLHNAAGAANVKVTEYLISRGADVNAKDNKGITPISYPLYIDGYKWVDRGLLIIQMLYEHKAEINVQNIYGNTPLHLSSERKECLKISKYLFLHGARTDVKNKDGETPYSFAVKNSNDSLVEFFNSQKK